MVQFNLLPDVKMNLLKAKRMNRLVMAVSFLAMGISVIIVALMLSMLKVQQKHISDLDKDIQKYSGQINNTPGIKKILTVQNQLKALPDLYKQRPAALRLRDYLDETVPATIVRIASLKIDFENNTAEIVGDADSLEAVNKYVDTLKFTSYTVGDDKETKIAAFTEVVMTSFGRDDKGAKFTVQFNFDHTIFDETQKITLVVPTQVTTRSELGDQSDLFNGNPAAEEEQ